MHITYKVSRNYMRLNEGGTIMTLRKKNNNNTMCITSSVFYMCCSMCGADNRMCCSFVGMCE